MRTLIGSAAFAALFAVSCAGIAQANTITDGFTFAVATAGGGSATGSHFHSSTGGDFGNPAGKSEVGSFFSEEVRGLSEYDLTGLSSATSAFVTFDVYKLAGLFPEENDFPYVGDIAVDAYSGNNTEDVSDFEAPSIGSVGTFSSTGLSVGDTLSFDITSLFNMAIAEADTSLGMRLAITGEPNGGALTFDTFRLTTDNQSSVGTVPLPATLPLLLAALGLVGWRARRRNA